MPAKINKFGTITKKDGAFHFEGFDVDMDNKFQSEAIGLIWLLIEEFHNLLATCVENCELVEIKKDKVKHEDIT